MIFFLKSTVTHQRDTKAVKRSLLQEKEIMLTLPQQTVLNHF